jgi:VanZ family protein
MANMLNKEKIFYAIMTFIIAVIIFSISSISSFPQIEKAGLNISIFYHFGVFFMLTFFLTLYLTSKSLDRKTILIVLLISLAYAISDEFHQLFVPGRFCSIKDALIDLTGSLCSILLIKIVKRFKKI